ncbi:MAG: hypothetical protein LC799_08120, partial [Actinobacteria bacterium]|nr:hypothetical protein [Actinomycetota bacterium]
SVYGDNGAALAGLERVRDEWSSPRQRKIVDVFLGNVWGRLNDRVQAESYYANALAVDPSYDRARLGLAEIDYQRGNGGCRPGKAVPEVINHNVSRYDSIFASSSGGSSYIQDIPERAAFGRGRGNLCLALATQNSAPFARAWGDFSFVIDRFQKGKSRLRSLAAESYANRGLSLLARATGDAVDAKLYMNAAEEYRAAIFLAQDNVRKGVFYGMLGFIQGKLDGSVARSCYLRAKELDPGRSHEYDAALAHLGASDAELPC